MESEVKKISKEMGAFAKVMLGLSLFLEFIRYATVAVFAGLLALGITAMVATLPAAITVFFAVAATITFVALVRTIVLAVAANKGIKLVTTVLDAADGLIEKSESTKASVSTQTPDVIVETRGRDRLFAPVRTQGHLDHATLTNTFAI